MSKMEKIINGVYITFIIVWIVMAMSSCGSSKQFHIGTGNELSKSKCSGNYVYK